MRDEACGGLTVFQTYPIESSFKSIKSEEKEEGEGGGASVSQMTWFTQSPSFRSAFGLEIPYFRQRKGRVFTEGKREMEDEVGVEREVVGREDDVD